MDKKIKGDSVTIYVTKPYLPPLKEYIQLLEKIWESRILTNNGIFHKEFERKLSEYLKVENISLYSNATLALIASLKILDIEGEVITTPYSFVATSSSILQANCTPVYVDIDIKTGNIDPHKIEKAITKKTTAILAVHCYGNPCNYRLIKKIADKYKLKIIYDACHAFGVKVNNESVLSQGDISIVSFHATKVFNTIEGACIISKSPEIKDKIEKFKNFGIVDEENINTVGINAKFNELQSALGLLQLKYIEKNINKRSTINQIYEDGLRNTKNISFLKFKEKTYRNYSYFPVIFKNQIVRDNIYNILKSNNIISRKYFYPTIPEFDPYKKYLDNDDIINNAKKLSQKILCLPMYPELKKNEIIKIINLINKNL